MTDTELKQGDLVIINPNEEGVLTPIFNGYWDGKMGVMIEETIIDDYPCWLILYERGVEPIPKNWVTNIP